MANRITKTTLNALIDRLNRVTDNPSEPYTRDPETDRYTANVGNYHLSGAYGGWALHQMANKEGGINDVLRSGHIPARDLYNRIHAYLYGLEAK